MTDPSVIVDDLDGSADGVRVIRINRPERRNALNLATKNALIDALEAADNDVSVRAVILTGTGSTFVAGTDVSEMATFAPTDHLILDTGRLFMTLDELSTPVIAAVEGYALGGGCELAMACDLVVAGESARFGQPEIKVGLIPGAGGVSRLIQRAGRARALQAVLIGEPFSATTAQQMGIVSSVVPDGTALGEAGALAAAIAARPPLNIAAIRRIARNAESAPLNSAIALERTTFQLLFDTADHTEGLEAFLARRPPSYEGK
ncbi:enoyl-CoA hydratase-related protein (plasmid) [Prescottella equi]|uniref:enoyl-CoA hydratase-related protein n=1 Tax=Rhodococcus hoagii TaxID=43767 RepID=UPI002575AC2B|nr:enoyl-CoA hydratase-related protein [Prescottella equi]WJJ14271.1 enoyl-CoA hydratase-related protein [Prescottella equi]